MRRSSSIAALAAAMAFGTGLLAGPAAAQDLQRQGITDSEILIGAFGPFARALEKHYGLSREAVSFWDVHEIADQEHSDVGDHIVVSFADTPELQEKVRRAVQTSLERWWGFFDGIQAAIDAHAPEPPA